MRIKIKIISNITSFNHIDIYETKDLLPEKVSDDKYLFKRKINNNRIPFFYNCGNKNVYNLNVIHVIMKFLFVSFMMNI